MSRNAWVIQITDVRLNSTIAKAPKVDPKMYRLMAPKPGTRSSGIRNGKRGHRAGMRGKRSRKDGSFNDPDPSEAMRPDIPPDTVRGSRGTFGTPLEQWLPKPSPWSIHTRFTTWLSQGKAVENASKKVNPGARFTRLWLPDHDPSAVRFHYG
ncbi:MAG: hypothetical protein AB7V13_03800 [Pseudorhodoplanes sp.]